MNRKRLVLLLIEAIVYIITSLAFFGLIPSIANEMGSTVSVNSLMAPFWLSVALLVYFLFVFHLILFPESEKKLVLTLKVNGIVMAALSFLAAILIIVYVASGKYTSLVAGVVTPLFPLDYLIADLVLCGLGIYATIYSFKKKIPAETLYFPYRYGKVRKVVSSFFRGFWVVLSLYMSACFILFVGIANYGSSTWWHSLFMWFLLGAPLGELLYREFFYRSEEHTPAGDLKRFAITLIVASSLTILFLIALLVNPNFIVEDATALFPLDFMKSWNVAPYLVSLTALLPPVVAVLSSLPKRKKKEEAPKEEAK